jgi:hypothetical protein
VSQSKPNYWQRTSKDFWKKFLYLLAIVWLSKAGYILGFTYSGILLGILLAIIGGALGISLINLISVKVFRYKSSDLYLQINQLDEKNKTHVSIQRALDDGCDAVNIIGSIGDTQYFNNYISPILKSNSKVKMIPFQTDKQSMYDLLGRVYHSSNGEVACLVKDECYLTNTKFFGNDETENEVSKLDNLEILNLWKEVLGI